MKSPSPMRLALLASLVLLTLLSCGGRVEKPASISRRAGEPFGVAYGPAFAHRLKDDEARRVWNLGYVPSGAEHGQKSSSYFSHEAHGLALDRLSEGSLPAVLEVDRHQLLSTLLGDARLFLMGPTYFVPTLVAARAGRVYTFPEQFGILLQDCGIRFAPEDVRDWARMLVTLHVCDSTMRARWDNICCGDTAPVIQTLRFDSVKTLRVSLQRVDVQVYFELGGAPRREQFRTYVDVDAAGDTIWWPAWDVIEPLEQGSLDGGPSLDVTVRGTLVPLPNQTRDRRHWTKDFGL